ncbi:MAG: hypothetical protein ABW076_11495 [Candidatus Thiodiazotropha sp.]
MRIFIFVLSLTLALTASAYDREARIKQLMEAQGLLQTFNQQLELAKIKNHEDGRQILDQVLTQLNPPAEFQARFENAYTTFIEKIEAPWTAQEIVEVWSQHYGSHFTNGEIDQLLEYYTSALAQKEVIASRQALKAFTEHFQNARKPILQEALSEYIEEMKMIARECKCSAPRSSQE